MRGTSMSRANRDPRRCRARAALAPRHTSPKADTKERGEASVAAARLDNNAAIMASRSNAPTVLSPSFCLSPRCPPSLSLSSARSLSISPFSRNHAAHAWTAHRPWDPEPAESENKNIRVNFFVPPHAHTLHAWRMACSPGPLLL